MYAIAMINIVFVVKKGKYDKLIILHIMHYYWSNSIIHTDLNKVLQNVKQSIFLLTCPDYEPDRHHWMKPHTGEWLPNNKPVTQHVKETNHLLDHDLKGWQLDAFSP